MDTDLNNIVSELLLGAAADLKLFFGNLVRNERRNESKEYMDNPEETSQMQEEIDATDVEFEVEGTTIGVRIVTSGSEYDKISTEGMHESYSGGQGGMVTLPSGEQVPSKVNPNFWGQPVLDSAEPPSVWKENSVKMIQSLLPGQLTDFIESNIGGKLAPAIGQMLTSQFAGGAV